MNFIASTLISSVGNDEELAFWIFMNLLITRDMKTLFLPVSIKFRINRILGSARVTSKEFSDGLADQVSHAKAVFPFTLDPNDHRLLHIQMDYDSFCMFPPLRPAARHLRHVLDGRLESYVPDRHRPVERDGEQSVDDGHGGYVQLLP